MGTISFKYKLNRSSVTCEELVNEIEYGTTFALSAKGEEVIPLRGGELQWITWRQDAETLFLYVDDEFFQSDDMFEKLMSAFVYNLLDFGDIRLMSLDIPEESRSRLFSPNVDRSEQTDKLRLGTILKPYYHLSMAEKVILVEQFADRGINVIKEDETYFCPADQLRDEAVTLQNVMSGRGIYVPNVTHYVGNQDLIATLLESGITVVMVNVLVAGFRSINDLKRRFPEVRIWGHRVGFSLLQRLMSMHVFGTLALLAGVTYLHVGTPRTKKELLERVEMIAHLKKIKPSFIPVFTKTTDDLLVNLLSQFGKQAVYMACGGLRDPQSGSIEWEKVDKWVEAARDE